MPETRVTRSEERSRYEIHAEGTLAGFAEFRASEGRIVFTHTETLPEFQGQGMGLTLAKEAVADAVARDELIVPVCPFFERYLRRNEVPGARIEWPS